MHERLVDVVSDCKLLRRPLDAKGNPLEPEPTRTIHLPKLESKSFKWRDMSDWTSAEPNSYYRPLVPNFVGLPKAQQ